MILYLQREVKEKEKLERRVIEVSGQDLCVGYFNQCSLVAS